jgi:hypothetical protein
MLSGTISEFTFQRDFQISVPRFEPRQILLRSHRSVDWGTLVDVSFKGVKAPHLPTILQELSQSQSAWLLAKREKIGVRVNDNGTGVRVAWVALPALCMCWSRVRPCP